MAAGIKNAHSVNSLSKRTELLAAHHCGDNL